MIELNKHLAEKVMGWTEWTAAKNGHNDLNDAYTDGVKHKIEIEDWNPSENIEQAMMCLDIFTFWSINRTKKGYEAMIITDKEAFGDHIELHDSLPMAISLACAKATGWEE